ncbi:IS4 family transposase [bacterium]|nr:IS4 family transposase [bacterium]
MANRSDILKQHLFSSLGLPWRDALPESRMESILEAEGIRYRHRLYTPIVTVWGMIYQVLCPDGSLRETVKWLRKCVLVERATPPSSDTGAYSKARTRLPERLLRRLLSDSAEQLEQEVSEEHQWCGRRVRVFDGSTILMSDSAANQAAYPQHGNQQPGCGFPIARIVVFFSLITGAVVLTRIAAWTTSETEISRSLYSDLSPGDVVMADQLYGSYVDLALIQQQGCDGMLRKQHARKTDFRKGKKHGIGDHQVEWRKPTRCPKHMSQAEFDALPATLPVREVSLRLTRKGWRDQCIIVVTTLLDAQHYTARQLTELYGYRWRAAEINLRHLKTTLNLEFLAAKRPEMVRKELWVHLLAYNLLRSVMEQAAPQAGFQRERLSLQGTRQGFRAILSDLAVATQPMRTALYADLLQEVAQDLLPQRPQRQEPRVLKRRPKPFPRMRQPRSILKAKLAA